MTFFTASFCLFHVLDGAKMSQELYLAHPKYEQFCDLFARKKKYFRFVTSHDRFTHIYTFCQTAEEEKGCRFAYVKQKKIKSASS
jgi:hypothetical protein